METVIERNARVTKILNDFLSDANNEELKLDETLYARHLDTLFSTDVWGFREILLVVVVAMKLDPKYRASTHLYECKPRAIYETPIKKFLIEHNIPHRKSGPLNVAKATEGLNDAWAAQRSPKKAAESVVHIVQLLENDKLCLVDSIGISLIRRFLGEVKRVEALNVTIEPTTDPEWLFHLSSELVKKAPDAGNTPQKIAALLLWTHHQFMHTDIRVTGIYDRASVTSTTSKKPGDVNEEDRHTKQIYKVYEITVKPFDLARIRDSYDCIHIYNKENQTDIHEVIVICRPEDTPAEIAGTRMSFCMGSYRYQDVTYYYWDIYEWMCFMLQRMTGESRSYYYHGLNHYISEINTAEHVKKLWKQLHEDNK